MGSRFAAYWRRSYRHLAPTVAIFVIAVSLPSFQLFQEGASSMLLIHMLMELFAIFVAGLIVHVALKFRKMMTGLRSRSLWRDLRTPLAATQPEAPDPDGLRAASPARPTMSRRGMLVAVGGASLTLAALAVGQSIGGWTRRTALFAPRGLSAVAPGSLPVNHTAAAARITATDIGSAYRLVVSGRRTVSLTRHQLMALPQRTAVLPLACVEGWSYSAAWTGVPLADLARLAEAVDPVEICELFVEFVANAAPNEAQRAVLRQAVEAAQHAEVAA